MQIQLTTTLTQVWAFISTNKMLIKPLNKGGALYSSWNMVQLTIRSFSTCNLGLNSNSMVNTCWRASLTFFVLTLVIGPPSPSKDSLPCPHQEPWRNLQPLRTITQHLQCLLITHNLVLSLHPHLHISLVHYFHLYLNQVRYLKSHFNMVLNIQLH